MKSNPFGVSTIGTLPKKNIEKINPFGITPKTAVASKIDLTTPEGLLQKAQESGIGKEAKAIVNKVPKLSFLQRIGKGLGAFNPAEAILTGTEQGAGQGALEYGKNIGQGVLSAFTGKDYEPDRRYFSDVAEKMGIENSILKWGIGFAGDILLDPTTYFGGAIAKGIGAGVKGAGKITLKGIGKIAPETETGLKLAGAGLQDAMGRAFQYGYKSTEGAKEKLLTFMSRKSLAKIELAASNLDRLGTGVLSKAQREELALKMIAGKRAEYQFGEEVSQNAIKKVNDLFPELKVTDANKAEKILNGLEDTTQKSVEKIRNEVDQIVKPFFETRQSAIKKGMTMPEFNAGIQSTPALGSYAKIDELNKVVNRLKNQLKKIKGEKGTIGMIGKEPIIPSLGGKITKEESIIAHNSLLNYEEQRLGEVIEDLSKKLENLKNKPNITPGIKPPGISTFPMTPAETIIYGERLIKKLQNDLATKSQLLDTAIRGRISGSSLIKTARETGDYSKIQAIAPDLVEKIKLNSTDPLVQKTIEEQLSRSKKFSEGITENPYEIYFPFIKKDKLQKFLNESTEVKIGSEGYRKQFKNLLTDENLEMDPAQAFFTRESQIVSDKMTKDFLDDFVKSYGKELNAFKNSDDAAKEGYYLIKDKGIFGKELGWVNKYDAALIKDSISPEFQTINMLAKATGFDAVTSLFKRSVTGLFVPFHIRNYVSGIIQNFEALGKDTLNPKNIAIGQKIAYLMGRGKQIPDELITVGGKTQKFSDLMKPFIDRFTGDTFYNNDFEIALKSGLGLKSSQKILSKSSIRSTLGFEKGNILPLVGQEGVPIRTARAIGQFIEHQQKATAYVTALSQGKTIDNALKLAANAGFDYRALTRFESQIMRRIVPFYSFARFNTELQLKTLGENPQRINQILRFFGSMGERPMGEEKKNLPAYIQESIGIKLPDTPEGLKQYITSFGTPIEAFAQLFGKNPILKAISQMNPILKTPIEIGIGKDSFRQRDLKDVYAANEYEMAPQIIKDMLNIHEVEKPIYAKYKDKDGNPVIIGTKKTYVADPEKLLIARSLFTSRGVSYLDQVFGNDLKGFVKALKTTTGLKPQVIDIETQKYFNELEQKRSLEDLLTKIGAVKKYEIIYTPKKK